ncbi:hypothetical protein PHSC3_000653 [Chlamydiales bacterium STE3]|nr:hypothetical protein PHSC3_000653 [Chlamydiales bacterium STE3]
MPNGSSTIFYSVQGETSKHDGAKAYIANEQIVLSDGLIYVLFDNVLYEVAELGFDEKGCYAPHFSVYKSRCGFGRSIKCMRCYGCTQRKNCIFACQCYH